MGAVDSNTRRPKTGDLQSPAIAAMRHPRKIGKSMLAKGLEPSTVRLQGGCSTIEHTSFESQTYHVPCYAQDIYITGFGGSSGGILGVEAF